MARPHKIHVQEEMQFPTWGGKRANAGRRQVRPRKSEPHRARPRLQPTNPVHVVLRVVPAVGRLRRRPSYKAIRRAMQVVLDHADFRIVHVSIQATHLHLLVEAANETALAKGMQAFEISAARRLNAAAKRRGTVFADRYHPEVIDNPRQAHHCLGYVLNNWRKHGEHRATTWRLDPYSSAISFAGWTEHPLYWEPPESYERLPVCVPQTWLLYEAWKRHGTIAITRVPG